MALEAMVEGAAEEITAVEAAEGTPVVAEVPAMATEAVVEALTILETIPLPVLETLGTVLWLSLR